MTMVSENEQPNKENLLLWVLALESGQYTQARSILAMRNPDGTYSYCCLGVLCEVAVAHGLELEVHEGSEKTYNASYTLPPHEVFEWLGLSREIAGLRDILLPRSEFDEEPFAAELNDSYGFTFEQIAAAIRIKFNLGERETDDQARPTQA